MEVLTQKESIRILEDATTWTTTPRERDVKRVRGGLLVQEPDRIDGDARGDDRADGGRSRPRSQWADLLFAWKVCRHVRSNAIVFAKDGATVGIGAGQMSRVDSVRIAIEKAREALGDEAQALLAGSVRRLRRVLPLPRRPAGRDRAPGRRR